MSIESTKKLLSVETTWKGEEFSDEEIDSVNTDLVEVSRIMSKSVARFTVTKKPNRIVVVALFKAGGNSLHSGDSLKLAVSKIIEKIKVKED